MPSIYILEWIVWRLTQNRTNGNKQPFNFVGVTPARVITEILL